MKRIFCFMIVSILIPCSSSHGALTIFTPDIVHNSEGPGQFWIRDLSLIDNSIYDEQKASITAMNSVSRWQIDGIGKWRMATLDDMGHLWAYSGSEITLAFLPSLSAQFGDLWIGRYDEGVDSRPEHYTGELLVNYKSQLSVTAANDADREPGLGAWIVADSLPVPVPSSIVLLGGVLIFMSAIFRKERGHRKCSRIKLFFFDMPG